MKRIAVAPRADWPQIVESQGLIWHTDGATPYWDESAAYVFTLEEIERIEAATEECNRLYRAAGDKIAASPELLTLCGIPDWCHAPLRAAWRSGDPMLDYGRFDFGFDGHGEPKLFEFNCDTPTAMLEAGVVQWEWKEARFPDRDQYTSLHEKLIARWAAIAPSFAGNRVWFAHIADPSHEDTITTTYMRDLAGQAGLETRAVLIEDIGIDAEGRIVDHEDALITAIFKLYPWEWIIAERFGRDVVRHLPDTAWIEPIWKLMWSNKAVLKILWDMFPNHPNLLAASFEAKDVGDSYVSKPILAREGANIEIVEAGHVVARSEGAYAKGATLYQARHPLRDFGNGYPVIGAWIVAGEPAGMGIREDGLITGNTARFIPHIIEG